MTQTRHAYLAAADSAAALLADPAVAEHWDQPSALAEFGVSGLAGHLARQVLTVGQLIALPAPDLEPRSLLDHYRRSTWLRAPLDHETSRGVRETGAAAAAGGPVALAASVAEAVATLRDDVLPGQPSDRVLLIPWTGTALRLDDYLATRMLEISVHNDDLAVSVGVPTPEQPAEVIDPVLDVLTRLAVERHGQTAVLRALSRAERAPATIAAL